MDAGGRRDQHLAARIPYYWVVGEVIHACREKMKPL